MTIFFDLDSTLIRAKEEAPTSKNSPAPLRYGPYFVWLRPCAPAMIATAKAMNVPLYLCTCSQRLYATGISKLFDLGFAEQQILGCEHMLSGQTGLAPDAVLIDDLPPDDEIAKIKRLILGIGPERYFQVPAFNATTFDPEDDLIARLQNFLRKANGQTRRTQKNITEEITRLIEDPRLLPSKELAQYAADKGWLGVRHLNSMFNIQDRPLPGMERKLVVCTIQRWIFAGYLCDLLDIT